MLPFLCVMKLVKSKHASVSLNLTHRTALFEDVIQWQGQSALNQGDNENFGFKFQLYDNGQTFYVLGHF